MIELARNSELDEELSRRIQARMLLDFPKIHQRIQDANNAPIDELLLTAKTLSVLKRRAASRCWTSPPCCRKTA